MRLEGAARFGCGCGHTWLESGPLILTGMTDEQRKRLFELLRGALQASISGYEARRCDLDERLFDTPSQTISHLLWMMDELEAGSVRGEEKLGRWVGFLQGAMWMSGYASINELRQMIITSEEI